ncbi:MAG: hypothetical protein AAFP17_14260 [Pseudomonadota bacterium]
MDVLNLLAVLGALGAATFTGWQALQANKQFSQESLFRKRERSASYSVHKNPEYHEARLTLANHFGSFAGRESPVELTKIRAAIRSKRISDRDIVRVLSHWERMCVEIDLGLADEKAAFEINKITMTNTYFALREYIEERMSREPLSYPRFSKTGEAWLERRRRLESGDDLPWYVRRS